MVLDTVSFPYEQEMDMEAVSDVIAEILTVLPFREVVQCSLAAIETVGDTSISPLNALAVEENAARSEADITPRSEAGNVQLWTERDISRAGSLCLIVGTDMVADRPPHVAVMVLGHVWDAL